MANILPNDIVGHGDTIIELPRRISKDIHSNSTQRTFRGYKSDIIALATTLNTQGYFCQLTQGPLWTLEASVGTLLSDVTSTTQTPGVAIDSNVTIDWDAETIGTWSYGFRSEPKDLLECDTVPLVAGNMSIPSLYPEVIEALKDFSTNSSPDGTPNYNWEAVRIKYAPISTSDLNQQFQRAKKLELLIKSGYKNHNVETLVIKQTILLPIGNTTIADRFANFGGVLTVTNFLKNENAPAWLRNLVISTLPGLHAIYGDQNFRKEVNPSPIDGGSAVVLGKKYGFKKSAPQLDNSSEQRLSLSFEYVYGLWSTDLFTVAF